MDATNQHSESGYRLYRFPVVCTRCGYMGYFALQIYEQTDGRTVLSFIDKDVEWEDKWDKLFGVYYECPQCNRHRGNAKGERE